MVAALSLLAVDGIAAVYIKNQTILLWVCTGGPTATFLILQNVLLRRARKELASLIETLDRTCNPPAKPRPFRFRLPFSRN
jgi:hypothetical protein